MTALQERSLVHWVDQAFDCSQYLLLCSIFALYELPSGFCIGDILSFAIFRFGHQVNWVVSIGVEEQCSILVGTTIVQGVSSGYTK